MIKEFLEKRRIYKLVKQNKDSLFLSSFDDSFASCKLYDFTCKKVGILTLFETSIYFFHPFYIYYVSINNVSIDGWYGWKLSRLLKKVISKHNKEDRLKN